MTRRRLISRLGYGLLLGLALLILVGGVMLDLALKPSGGKARDLEASYRYMFATYPGLEAWVDSLRHADALRDTTIVASDGVRLHALYVEAHRPTRATAVIVHGYTDNAIRMLMIGRMFHHDLGYNILLPDLRNSGLSEGNHYNMGWFDRHDVRRWIDVANNRFGGDTQMVLHGISMGAATVMMLSGDDLPAYVRCVVEDCGYTSVWDEFAYRLKADHGLPAFPLIHIASAVCAVRYGWSFGEASALAQVRRSRLPMLFIHGQRDDYVPDYMVHSLYEAKSGDKELWITPATVHATSYRDAPAEYTARVAAFAHRYISP